MSAMLFEITGASIVCSTVVQAQIKNIQAPRQWPLWGELTGDWWIPFKEGQ